MRLISLLLVFALIAPMLVAQGKAAAQSKADDRIYDDVRRRLADDPEVKGAAIEVTITNGAITLKGRVRDEKAREKATRVAKKVKGVTTVDNQLKLFSED
ncbi:MAG TPA: BON domain-containing protein [Bryobacteraceae bacterium]|jgi:hyperosmotically inducible protein|nr:BON domain-containing protein [Bryobacteraceae bacterium]